MFVPVDNEDLRARRQWWYTVTFLFACLLFLQSPRNGDMFAHTGDDDDATVGLALLGTASCEWVVFFLL